MSTRGGKSRAQRQPLVGSQVWDTRQLLMHTSQTQAEDDENDDDDADIQDQESTDPSRQVIGISEVRTIGMYANQSRLYLYIYT
jgi:hypothetical protein